MNVVVIIATYGRPELAKRTLERLAAQTRRPDLIVVSAPDESHIKRSELPGILVKYVVGTMGLSAQRNAALAVVVDRCDLVIFFDDDFLPADDYIERTTEAFGLNPDWAVVTGHVIKDGISNCGISYEDAETILAQSRRLALHEATATDWHAGYGCNMAIRAQSIGPLRFDERLVLYAWQEDADFSRRVAAGRGRIIRHTALRGVHMGIKSGRVSGVRFGYSQIINPVYLVRKGSLTPILAARLVLGNLAANAVRAMWAEPWIDRFGRLRGNLIGLRDLVAGRIEPERARNL